MKNTYVQNHNWGSFEKNSTKNKLLLRNYNDLNAYLGMLIPIIFETQNTHNAIKLQDNRELKFVANLITPEFLDNK